MISPTIITLAETGSTNDDLKDLARNGAAEGAWIRADRQTKGRGRQGRSWDSPTGNLYASTLVRLRDGDPPAPSLALVAGVALWDALFTHFQREDALRLKWPNDLLLGGAKLAGILLEREDDAIIIGWGVNLAFHPETIDRPATSLAAHSAAPAPDLFVESLAAEFADRLDRWRAEGLSPLRDAWESRAHPRGTALTTHNSDGSPLAGTFDGLAADGALRLRLKSGETRVIHAGDVFLV